MKSKAFKSWLLMSPLILAFILQKAHNGLTFLPVFILSSAVFLFFTYKSRGNSLPMMTVIPFGLLAAWSWLSLLGGAPLDIFLLFFSRLFLFLIIGILIFQFADDLFARHFENLLFSLGVLEAMLIIIAFVRNHIDPINLDPQWAGYLMNPLHSGILLPAAFGVGLGWIGKKETPRWNRAGFLIAVVAIASATIFIRSRSGILCLAAISFYFFPKKILVLGISAVCALLIWGFIQPGPFMLFFELDPGRLGSSVGRISIWTTALHAIRAEPLIGYGLGNFEMAFQLFHYPANEIFRYSKSTMFAHNGLLQVATDTGIPGALCLLWGFGTILKITRPLWLIERGLISVVIVFFVTSLFNYSLFHPFNALVFTGAVALLLSKAPKTYKKFDLSKHMLVPKSLMVFLTVFLFSNGVSEALQNKGHLEWAARICPMRSETWYQLCLKSSNQPATALRYIDQALIWNKQNAFYWQRKALILMSFPDAPLATIDTCLKRAQELYPHHAPFYVQEGFFRLKNKQYELAVAQFQNASMLEPVATIPHFGLAHAYSQMGDLKAAQSHAELGLSLKKQQLSYRSNPATADFFRELMTSPYGQFLNGDGRYGLNRN